jgi:DNA repair exonuclease SbcCD nuclease subunit
MKPAYGLAADLHFHNWSAFSTVNLDGLNSRLAGQIEELHRLCAETRAAGGQIVVLAGDIFHVRGSVAPSVLNPVRDAILHEVGANLMQFYILAGNHDLEGKEATRIGSAVTALEMDGVVVINEPEYVEYIGGGAYLVPWHEKIDDLKKAIEFGTRSWEREDTDLILHAPIDGVIEGLPPHGLTPEYLAGLGFKRVFSGHYHNHKTWKFERPCVIKGTPGFGTTLTQVTSIGALSHHSWSDIGSKAGFVLVHPDRIDWRKSHLPAFIDLGELVEVEEDDLFQAVDGNYVRVRVEGSKVAEMKAVVEDLKGLGARGVIVQPTPAAPVRERADGTALSASVAAGASIEASVGDFIKTAKLVAAEALVTAAAMNVLEAAAELETE